MKHCGGNSIYDGIGWYRRYFKLPAKYKDKRIVVSFEGVMTNCDVYLNGQKVTEHHGGYMGFVADLTDRIDWNGNNVLAVRVSAEPDPLTPPGKPQDKMDFYYYSGIYRDVRMVITDKVYITDPLQEDIVAGGGQFVTYPEVTKDKARAHLATHVRNLTDKDQTLSVFSQLVDSAGHVIAEAETPVTLHKQSDRTVEQDLFVNQPALWHPYTPNLYTLRTQLLSEDKVLDETTRKIGIRTIRYTAEEGFFINGEKLYMRGANRHQAFANVGDAASNSMQVRDVIDLKRGGYNAVRAAHYPNDPAFLEACDRYGLLVVECIPGWQFYNPDSIFIERLYEIGRQMIRRDRNHPSVVLWETALNESRYPVSLAKEIFELSHAEYPGDQMYTAGDYFGHAEMEPYYDVFYKQVSKFPKDGDVMSNYPEDFIVVKPLFTREWGDGVGEKPRVSLKESEEEQMRQCRSRIEQLNGKGYFDWCMLDANPHMGGTNELKIDQSVAHNGVCLTVVAIDGDRYTVTAMKETLDRSNLGELKVGDRVNVERSMLMNGRLDGHIVQGHVDGTAVCKEMRDADGSTYYTFEYKFDREMAERGYFTVDKGSVTVNGVSLTVCDPTENSFTVAIIPYTHDNTNFCDIKVGSRVNIEFDILGKYIARLQQLK